MEEEIEDPSYGKLVFEHVGWGHDGDINAFADPIESHSCTDFELGLTEENGKSDSNNYLLFEEMKS